jgi:hypothetical protein
VSRTHVVLFAGLFGVVGIVAVVMVMAAGSGASYLVAGGTLAGSATKVSNAGAIGGQMVVFGSTPTPTATPTPTPTGTPTPGCSGAANHVAGGADGTGTCWPGPSNTGVPAGTVLTAYTGPCVITTDNTVIDSKTINGCDGLGILAINVTIKNSKINTYVALDSDRVGGINFSATITDSEINGGGTLQSAAGGANLTLIRDNIYGGINGSECDPPMTQCTIRDSYLHGQTYKDGIDTHLGGFLSDGGTNLTIVHNTIVCDTPVNNVGGGCTGDFNMIPNFASINGALIQHNLFGASPDGSYCTYGGEKSSSPTPHSYNIVYKDNIFQRGPNNQCAAYGPVTGFAIGNTGNQWVNNTWANGGAVQPEN